MDKYIFDNFKALLLLVSIGVVVSCSAKKDKDVEKKPTQIAIKNWMPKSIHKAGDHTVKKPQFPAIDLHAHDYATTPEEVERRVEIMDKAGIEKSVVFTGATGAKFDSVYALYSEYPDRFDVYCGIDFSGYKEEGWSDKAVKELERCEKVGAGGIGELHDKGGGLVDGMHPNDPRMEPVFEAAADLNLPINLHVADPIWMYEPMDSTNDGLIRAYTWRIKDKENIISHDGMLSILDKTLERNPNTTFVAAHLANSTDDLDKLGELLDKHPNLYADVSARFAEFSTIPRTASDFFEKYQDQIVYGTDYGWETFDNNTDYGNHTSTLDMFRMTFRVLETRDEHFYMTDLVGYKWPMYGLDMSEKALKKIYRENALNIIKQ